MTLLKSAVAALLLFVLVGFILFAVNRTPVVPPLVEADVADQARPFVVKLHAQWCPKCLATRGVWSEIAQSYQDRARFVVFDLTNSATTAASRAEAVRLGLESTFDDYEGVTGAVLVVDGGTGAVTADISSFDLADYQAAIDAALEP